MAWRGGYSAWPEYVPVATKIARGKKAAEKLRKKGVDVQPVELSGRTIASSFWGKAWCEHMESFRDYESRLPRGRSYVRNGSVVHLDVGKGAIKALVAGSEPYLVEIKVDLLPPKRWKRIKDQCTGQIASLLDLLKGKLSDGVMRVVADRDNGLFPGPGDFTMSCSCPDYAGMCKHIAAVFYGVGARLDARPELLFLLRGVDHAELTADGGVEAAIARGDDGAPQLADTDLSEMFGIELLARKGAGKKIAAAAAKSPRKDAAVRKGRSAKETARTLPRRTKPSGAAKAAGKAKKEIGAQSPSASGRLKTRPAVTAKRKPDAPNPRTTVAGKPRQSPKNGMKKRHDAAHPGRTLKMTKKYVAGKKGATRNRHSG
jgi:uncharacterized Zn finger protein